MPRNRSRRPLGSLNNPRVQVVVSATVGNENAIETGKALLIEATSSATMRTIHGRPVMANDEGASLVETMLTCRSEIANLRKEVENRIKELENRGKELENRGKELENRGKELENRGKELENRGKELENRTKELEKQNLQLTGLHTMYLDVRECAFLTFLRDRCRGYRNAHRAEIQALNRSVVHGGNAAVDATMFEDRRPTDELHQFIHIYGIAPSTIKQIVSKDYKKILRVLNAVGGYHLQGLSYLKDEEESLFRRITRLVEEGKLDEAEEISNNFPFERNEVEVEPIIGGGPDCD